jgi:hypothetical protein
MAALLVALMAASSGYLMVASMAALLAGVKVELKVAL